MLLLYPTCSATRHRNNEFTFHYASTLSERRSWTLCFCHQFTFHYASTLSFFHIQLRQTCHAFTFHYASTLSCGVQATHYLRANLHSIMLLLYRGLLDKKVLSPPSFTFHYASTLSRIRWWIPSMIQYLHSIMLLLYLRRIWKFISSFSIYIPLCFYFIHLRAVFWDDNIYLHSIMLLLYQNVGLNKAESLSPFTFHYASTLSYVWDAGTPLPRRFTFHYASTLSRHITRMKTVLWIYIPLCFYFIPDGREREQRKGYLHSIMLLLYRTRTSGYSRLPFIYIPLCFYFIFDNYKDIQRAIGFTFHYASTLST